MHRPTCANVIPIGLAIGIIFALGIAIGGLLGNFQISQINSLTIMGISGGVGLVLLTALIVYKVKYGSSKPTHALDIESAEVTASDSKSLQPKPVNYEFRVLGEPLLFNEFQGKFISALEDTKLGLASLAKDTKIIIMCISTPTIRYILNIQHNTEISSIMKANPEAKFFLLCSWYGPYQPGFADIKPQEFDSLFEKNLDGFVWLDLPYENRAPPLKYSISQNVDRVIDCIKTTLT